MNSNVLLIRDKATQLSNKIIEEIKPKEKTIVQFSYYNKIFISKEYKQNISIPTIPNIEQLNFPISSKIITRFCVFNDWHYLLLSKYNIPAIKLGMYIQSHSKKIGISNAFKHLYKYGIIINFQQDMTILEDVICLFYEANKNFNESILLIAVESNDSSQVFSFIDKIHQNLNIKTYQSKLIVTVNSSIDDDTRISIINTIDCLLQLNTVWVSDIEYYYGIFSNKKIIGKYNLDNQYSIETIPYQNKLFKFENQNNFYHQFDHHSLYEKFRNIEKYSTIKYDWKPNESTGISKIIT